MILVFIIRVYQKTISEVSPHRCRFQPTCSEYAVEAVQCHGIVKGGWLALKRIVRCHPFATSRYDPVPRFRRLNEQV
ncbi:MAG: membrane protein insertion efficiency factor YidD [Chloroflexota bacterium]